MLRVLRLCYKDAIFEMEMRKCASRTTLVLQSCGFRAGAAEVYFAYYKVAILELGLRKRTSRTTLVLSSCDFEPKPRKCTSRTTHAQHSTEKTSSGEKANVFRWRVLSRKRGGSLKAKHAEKRHLEQPSCS